MTKRINYVLVLILILFVGNMIVSAETSGTGGIGGGASTGGSGSGTWDSKKYGFYIEVYNSSNVQKGTTYSQDVDIDGLNGWIYKTGDTSFASDPTKLYEYLEIPYPGYNYTYSTLLQIIQDNIIQDRNISLSSGDYILVQPYTKINGNSRTFRDIVSTTNVKVGGLVYYKNYQTPAIILANAAKVGTDITVGGRTYTAPSSNCDKDSYQNNKRCGWPNNNYIGYGITVVKYDDISKVINGKLYIEKQNSSGLPIVNNSATFKIYNDSNCKNEVSNFYTNTAGNATIELNVGKYYLKEIKAPKGYKSSGKCESFEIKANETTSLYIKNTQTCDSEFEALKQDGLEKDKISRINLYKKYKKNQLLNFSNTTTPCSATRDCGLNVSSTCTNSKINYSGFSSNNLSCYSTIENVDNKTAYCVYEYNYDSSFLNNQSFLTAGRIIFQDLENLGTGYLQKRCYSYDGSANYSGGFNYTDYIKSVNILDQELNYNLVDEILNNDKEYIYRKNIIYYKTNYLEKVSGLVKNNCKKGDCIEINGLITKFEKDIDSKDKFNLTFTPEVTLTDNYLNLLKIDNSELSNTITQSNYCNYSFNKELIKDNKPNLEFRIIDTTNPFPGSTGEGRIIGSNWCEGGTTCTSVGIENYNNLSKINDYIISTPNSNGIKSDGTKVEPKYVIDLNYETIKAIREYNKTNDYNSFKQTCDENGENCHSSFLIKFGVIS